MIHLSKQGTCVPFCSRLKYTWRRERCNFLIIISWHVPMTTQHGVRQDIDIGLYRNAGLGNFGPGGPVSCRVSPNSNQAHQNQLINVF